MKKTQLFWLFMRDIRTWYLTTFHMGYVEDIIKRRKGTCPSGCGECCLSGKRICTFFDQKTKRCIDYKNRPQLCESLPFDEWDMWLMVRILPDARCNFRWKKK